MARTLLTFNAKAFLSSAGAGREMLSFQSGQNIFTQGGPSDAVFVIQTGHVRVSARSQSGKNTTLDILAEDDFVGKDCLTGEPIRTISANALTDCKILRIPKRVMALALSSEITLANAFAAYVLARNMRYQQDLVDQHCNTSEKRLARILLLLSHFDSQSTPEAELPRIKHETLAEMVGTTRSRVSHFMKKFKRAGFIDYHLKKESIRVRRSLLAFYAR
jgi:CRP-like cAMP-binding protein